MKKSFTLLEILISITILSILFLAMGNIINEFKSSKNTLKKISQKYKKDNLLIKILYNDILNSKNIKIKNSKNSDFCRLYLTTSNSLYNLIEPNVLWYISKKNNTLVRVESYKKITLPNSKLFYLDKFAKNVKIFKIFQKKDKYFIYIESDKPIYFELIK